MPFRALLRTWNVSKIIPRSCHVSYSKHQYYAPVEGFKVKFPKISLETYSYHTTKSSISEHTFLREWPREKDFSTEFEDLIESLENPRIRLYPSVLPSDDPLLEEILQANTVDELFKLYETSPGSVLHSTQALVTLWTLQKSYSNWKTTFGQTHLLESLRTFLPVRHGMNLC